MLVVSAYLLYTIYEADWQIRLGGDFYQDLGVSHGASDRDIKSRFRRLAAIHHPDKATASSTAGDGYFVHLKLAQDTLLNPVKRFAYDRFGPSVTEWQYCASYHDYLMRGVQMTLPYYVGGAGFMYVLGLLGYLDWGKFWRWFTLAALCVFELYTISRPYSPPLIRKVVNPLLTNFTQHPPYLPFQIIQLARQLSITLYIAFSQIGPLLQSPESAKLQGDTDTVLREQLDRLDHSVRAANVEATRLMELERAPFVGDPQALSEVQRKIKEWLIQNTIRSDPEVRDAMGNVFRKRRVDAPAGAQGNK
jgi:hypothetical protein